MCCSCLNEHNKALSHRARRVRGDQAHLNPPSLISLDRKTQNIERFFFFSLSQQTFSKERFTAHSFFLTLLFLCVYLKKKKEIL